MVVRRKRIGIAIQAAALRKMFPEAIVTVVSDHSLRWEHSIRPSPLGEVYRAKLTYSIGEHPKAYILEPKHLALAQGAEKLPHMYDQKRQRLCLFYPDGKQWNDSMSIGQTIAPWIYEWLYHYEIWLGNGGNWTGGGVHRSPSTKHNKKTK